MSADARKEKLARYGFLFLGLSYFVGGMVGGSLVAIGIGVLFGLAAFGSSEEVAEELSLFGWRVPPLALLFFAIATSCAVVVALVVRAV